MSIAKIIIRLSESVIVQQKSVSISTIFPIASMIRFCGDTGFLGLPFWTYRLVFRSTDLYLPNGKQHCRLEEAIPSTKAVMWYHNNLSLFFELNLYFRSFYCSRITWMRMSLFIDTLVFPMPATTFPLQSNTFLRDNSQVWLVDFCVDIKL